MTKIGILSDTHSIVSIKVLDFLKNCKYIYHAGDIGSTEVIEKLNKICTTFAVYGNIDNYSMRNTFPIEIHNKIEDANISMTHIGGSPNKYTIIAKKIILENQPQLFITGHSHICKVIYDKKCNLLFINPGAAGNEGFHTNITAIRLDIDGKKFNNLELFVSKRY